MLPGYGATFFAPLATSLVFVLRAYDLRRKQRPQQFGAPPHLLDQCPPSCIDALIFN